MVAKDKIHVSMGSYKHQPVVLKGPECPMLRIQRAMRAEILSMQLATSPYVLPLLAVLDSTKDLRAPLAVAGTRPLFCPTLLVEHMEDGDLAAYHDALRYANHDTATEPAIVPPLAIAWVVANALLDLHAKNVLHRDIKSRNIFLSKRHFVRLGDLGSARTLGAFMTSSVGTICWIAPEVFRVPGETAEDCVYTSAADIYSFGVVLTELFTHTEPYSELVDRRNVETLVRTGQLRPRISEACPLWLRTLTEKCLAFDPTARPTAAEIVDELYAHRDEAGMSLMTATTETTPMIMPTMTEMPTTTEMSTES
ncbi:TKL protein kinase, partial [Saprolegnia diclina VS20]